MFVDLAHAARPRKVARAPEPEAPKKPCRCCKRTKSLTAFAPHPLAKDGHRHDCAKCVKAGKMRRCPKKSAANTRAMRKRRRNNPKIQARNRVAVREWSRRHPHAHRARTALSRALKRGELKKPPRCSVKGCARTKVEGHHRSYRAPLDVLWACRSHHRRLHAGEAIPLKKGIDARLAKIPKELAA